MQKSAREAALEILERCRRDKAWSGASIDNSIKKNNFDGREAALISKMCLGVMQNTALCDFYINCYCSAKLEPKVRDVLRLGVYQILFLDRIPDRAAVSESVELCRKHASARAAGLVNAVLRKIADNKNALPEIPGKGTAEYLAVKYSHPSWIAEYAAKRHGYDFAEAFLKANNETPALTIQVNTLKISAEEYSKMLSDKGIEHRLSAEIPGGIELCGGSAAALPGFENGLFYVQDRAARTAVEIAAPCDGMTVLDACSCPGGKSFAAGISMNNTGKILSCDIHEKKLNLVKTGAERLGIDIIQTSAADARVHDAAFEESFDVVIADVPCSGMGVIGKKPEIRNKTWDEISGMPKIQADIIENLASYVKPGGVLLYSTCTILHRENEDVVRAFLQAHPEFTAEPLPLPAAIENDGSGMLTLLPGKYHTDGFFICKLRRKL